MSGILITNNELARDFFAGNLEVVFVEGSYEDVLATARDRVHMGHKLLTHPLSGSVKPNENPYKSIIMSSSKSSLDTESLYIIENCIATAKKFANKYSRPTEQMKKDFQMIDLSLIKSAY